MERQNLALQTAGVFSGPKLMLNGQPLTKQNGCFHPPSSTRSTLTVKLKGRFLDPIPNVVVGGQTIQLAAALEWYRYVWTVPIVLVFLGRAGWNCLAVGISSRVFRSELTQSMKSC
jgi:hypothetical protein